MYPSPRTTPGFLNTKARTALVTWLVVYPLINLLLLVLDPLVAQWPMPLRTLLLTGLMVPVVVFWAMPLARKRFRNFLRPQQW